MGSDAMDWHRMAWDVTEGVVVKCQASSLKPKAREDREDCKGWVCG